MDVKLLPYFENVNDGGEQSEYLSQFGPKEVQDGICFNLALSWLYFFKNSTPPKAPNVIWQEMKTPTLIKQIANNQRGYIQDSLEIDVMLRLYHLTNQEEIQVQISDDIPVYVNVAFNHTDKLLVIIDLSKNGKQDGAHAISLIRHNGNAYMYDPNVGVMTTPFTSLEELVRLIKYIYEVKYNYVITGRCIIEIV